MLEDLCNAIITYRAAGDQIVLMIELNKDITKDSVKQKFESIGLQECITEKHTATGMAPTYQQGSRPIDGIYLSPSLDISTGGYFPFKEVPTDHRFLWVKIEFEQCFGCNMPPLASIDSRRLKTDDPQCVKRFNANVSNVSMRHTNHTSMNMASILMLLHYRRN